MAMEPSFFEPEAHFASDGDISLKHKWNSISTTTTEAEKDAGGFDCNICFESAQDPVVTLCGHLYCWPCIYKWLNVQTTSLEADERQQNCPVCKVNVSSSSLIPLYGRGISSGSASKNPHSDLVIPQRPPPSGLNALISPHPSQQLHENFFHSHSQSFHHPQYFPQPYGGYATLASSNLGGIAMTNFFNPMIGMFGEMVYARIFGSSGTSLFAYPYQASHPFFGNNNVRMRRQEMQLDKSLSRVSIFLFCCIVLCLLLF